MMHELYAPFRADEPTSSQTQAYMRQEHLGHLSRVPPRAPGHPTGALATAAARLRAILARLRGARRRS